MPKRKESGGFFIEGLYSIPFAEALEKRRLNEAIKLAWSAIEYGRTCGREIRFLAELLAVYGDDEGLALLRQKAEERAKDPRYQPPFREGFGEEGNVNLLQLIDKGTSGARLLKEILAYVRSHPGVTRDDLYRRFNVFKDAAAKNEVDKGKPKEERIGRNWVTEHHFRELMDLPHFGQEGPKGKARKYFIPEASPNLRPSPTFEPKQKEAPFKVSQKAAGSGCLLPGLLLLLGGAALLLLTL